MSVQLVAVPETTVQNRCFKPEAFPVGIELSKKTTETQQPLAPH